MRNSLEREVAPFKITFASRFKFIPYLICGTALLVVYVLAITLVALVLNIILPTIHNLTIQ